MENAYNKKLYKKYKNQICLFTSKNVEFEDDCNILYLKKKDIVESKDDIVIIGMISTFKDELVGDKERIVKSVSIPKFGNIIYAFSAMSLTERNKSLMASNELTSDAISTWDKIFKNVNYEKKTNIFNSKAVVEICLEPDINYKDAINNNNQNKLSKELKKHLKESAEKLFWDAYEANENEISKKEDIKNRTSYSDNNFEKLDQVLKLNKSKKATNKIEKNSLKFR